MRLIRLDAHVHLYDRYLFSDWVASAMRHLLPAAECGAVVVVDRPGQCAFTRCQRECLTAGAPWEWREMCCGQAGVVTCAPTEGGARRSELVLVRGAQYVSAERIEVLALGVGRDERLEGAAAADIVGAIGVAGGVPCLPWSPGKWLGGRGRVVARLLRDFSPQQLTVGDIALRTSYGPPSPLLMYARWRGFRTLRGSDPLPLPGEEWQVGAFSQEVTFSDEVPLFSEEQRAQALLEWLRSPYKRALPSGTRNGIVQASRRFVGSLRGK
jgi:hypothetical protein